MASDFYRFEGTVGSHQVSVEFEDYREPIGGNTSSIRKRMCSLVVDGENIACAERKRRRHVEGIIARLIHKGFCNLNYLGGWSPDGSYWMPDDVRHSHYDHDDAH